MTIQKEARTAVPGDARDANDAHPGQAAQHSDTTLPKETKAPRQTRNGDTPSSSENDTAHGSPSETGKSGETGTRSEHPASIVSNLEFITAIVGDLLPDGAFAAYCLKPGDPEHGGYQAQRWTPGYDPGADGTLNAYWNCGAFKHGPDGRFRARVDRNAGVLFLMLDDVGTKVPLERLQGVSPTWQIETSPGNFQVGLAFNALVDGNLACRIHAAMIAAGLCDAGAGQPKNRWARLPVAINGKPKHERDGRPWACKLTEWNPQARFTPDDIIEFFDLELPLAGARNSKARRSKALPKCGGRVFEAAATENAVIAALQAGGLYKGPSGDGRHDITCPWLTEHTEAQDGGTAYFEPSEEYPAGGFKCFHSHGDKLSVADLLEFLGVSAAAAEGRALVQVTPGELWRVVAAGEELLAADDMYFQRGEPAHIVRVVQRDGGAAINVCTEEGLLLALSKAARWERWDAKAEEWVVCDPPPRHVKALWRGGNLCRLLPLDGLARQPFFAPDGALVREPGYHAASKRFAVFNAADFVFPAQFNRADAEQALALLLGLLGEFAFASEHDRAAAIAGMLLAAARPSLPVAPAIHIRAPEFGSGKSYLADLLALFAALAAGDIARMSYPATSEEASKAILAALLAGPAVVLFDDMQADWSPFGAINRMLTSEWITDRILQESRIASASTRVLVLATGNNVGPVGDLLRRVNVIHLDHGEERPATKAYKGDPVEAVKRARGKYVCAALTIIAAYRAAGAPKSERKPLAGFGQWSDTCRQPLLWLGLADPAERMFENMRDDPGRDTVGVLFEAWHRTFGDAPTTVRTAIKRAAVAPPLFEAFDDIDVVERGEVNAKKLGWALKRASGRIARGYTLSPVAADGRQAWKVTGVKAQPSEPAPVSPLLPVFPAEPRAMAENDDGGGAGVSDRTIRRGQI